MGWAGGMPSTFWPTRRTIWPKMGGGDRLLKSVDSSIEMVAVRRL